SALGPATYGRWDYLFDMEAGGVELSIEHAALLRTGEVVFIESGTDTILWDPTDEVTPRFTTIPGSVTGLTADLFCSGHAFLSDGKLLVVGGGGGGPGAATSNQGWRFDPVLRTWTRTGDMTTRRWYPTALMLGDEQGPTGACARVLVAGGSGGAGGMEVYSEATNAFLPITVNGAITKHFSQTYPGLHMLPGGEILYAPTGFANCSTGSPGGYADGPAAWFTFDAPMGATSGHWTEVAGPTIDRAKGMSVLFLQPSYPFVRVTVIGGGPVGTNATAQTINLSTLSPTWGPTTTIPDGRARINVSAVLLPDSTIFVCGGLQAAPYPSWIYNPNAVVNAWREMDEMNRPRHYHACALLLPSGKVMMAGGASPGGCSLSVENSIEVFSPPYLFNADGTAAARPVISQVNGETPTSTHAPQFHHGDTFTVETPQAASIAKVVLIRPMAVTHQTDSEQRIVHMTFYQSGSTELTATAPDGGHPHAIAPRGNYMLFILNGAGVPSEGKFIHLH
ncbi:MAG: galactose oxidase-like domain-containing protein, partial [Gammaproteobacteria bacterium]